MKRILFLLLIGILPLHILAQNQPETLVLIKTNKGNIKIKLYNETPLHRDNFIKLVKDGFYEDLLFHRVMKGFMVQGGDPESKNAAPDAKLGMGGPGYTTKAEFLPELIHKKGALAAARQPDNINPEKESSGSQFYLVQGRLYTEDELKTMVNSRNQQLGNQVYSEILNNPENARIKKMIDGYQKVGNQKELQYMMQQMAPAVEKAIQERGFSYTEEQIKAYTTIGGTPFLDGLYTVFGEVVEGLEVIDKIAEAKVNAANKPDEPITMSMKIVKK